MSNLRKGLGFMRLIMVLGSFSPLFVLWSIRGIQNISDKWVIAFCFLAIAIPNIVLYWRISIAKKNKDKRKFPVGKVDDNKNHILVYLFTMLLPFYSVDINDMRMLFATIAALILIIYIFWHLNLHYMNILFAMCGYRIFTIYPADDDNDLTGRISHIFITRRDRLSPGDTLVGYRLSNTVYIEVTHET